MSETQLKAIVRLYAEYNHPRTTRPDRKLIYMRLLNDYGIRLDNDGERFSG